MTLPRTWRLAPLLGAALVLAGCATSYAPGALRPGMSSADVLQLMGPPNARHAQPDGGQRLEYARGPYGLHTYMVELDPQGRLSGWQQVLDEANFNAITPGMPREELLRRLGRPGQARPGGWQPGELWTYHFDNVFCKMWQVEVIDGRVRSWGLTPDPRCPENVVIDVL
jgi:hypothetical protein